MGIKGIRLKLDDDGKVATIDQPEGDLCSGVVICASCKDNLCMVKGVHWGNLRTCPFKKWDILLWHKTDIAPIGYPNDRCYFCGGRDFWKKKDGPLVCEACHPCPLPERKIERPDDTGIKMVPVPEKKKKIVSILVSVKKGPRRLAKQSKIFA
jgi:hypothetical protein